MGSLVVVLVKVMVLVIGYRFMVKGGWFQVHGLRHPFNQPINNGVVKSGVPALAFLILCNRAGFNFEYFSYEYAGA